MEDSKTICWAIDDCNYEEADYRMVNHTGKSGTKAVILSKDTDVLVLIIFAMTFKLQAEWFFETYRLQVQHPYFACGL